MKVVTSRAFNQDVSQAKRLAKAEPVFVTDRGRPTHVLLSYESFRQLAGQGESLGDMLAADDDAMAAAAPDWRAAARWGR